MVSLTMYNDSTLSAKPSSASYVASLNIAEQGLDIGHRDLLSPRRSPEDINLSVGNEQDNSRQEGLLNGKGGSSLIPRLADLHHVNPMRWLHNHLSGRGSLFKSPSGSTPVDQPDPYKPGYDLFQCESCKYCISNI